MLKKKWFVILTIIIVIIGIIIFLLSPRKTLERNTDQATQTEVPENDGELTDTKIRVPGPDQEGFWELKVEKMSEFGKTGQMFKINGQYFKNDVIVYRITADGGEINWEKQLITFKDKVRFLTNTGKKISSDIFVWDTKQKQITAKDNVTLTSPDLAVVTRQLNADHQFQKAVFSGMTKVLYQR